MQTMAASVSSQDDNGDYQHTWASDMQLRSSAALLGIRVQYGGHEGLLRKGVLMWTAVEEYGVESGA